MRHQGCGERGMLPSHHLRVNPLPDSAFRCPLPLSGGARARARAAPHRAMLAAACAMAWTAAGMTGCRAARGARPAPAPVGASPTGSVATGSVQTGGARLAYTIVPAAPAVRPRTIVVLHGGPGATHDYLRPEWDRLAAVGRVIYYDQRGWARARARGRTPGRRT